jgi:hypothetical protein
VEVIRKQPADPFLRAAGRVVDDMREKLKDLFAKGVYYAYEMATRPQTLYGIADSPVGLAAWLMDLGDGYAKPAAALVAIGGHFPAWEESKLFSEELRAGFRPLPLTSPSTHRPRCD